MTTIRLGVLHPTGTATDARSTGSLEWVPTARRVVGADVILPDAFRVTLSATADVTVDVAPTTTAWVWKVLERVKGGSGGWRYLAVPDSAEVVDYAALVEVDPATLDPIAVPEAAWWAAADVAAAELALKAPLASPAFTGTPTGITKTHVGLGSVDDTADAAKPVSTAQATALALKVAVADLTDPASAARAALEGAIVTQGFGKFLTARELRRKGGVIGTAGKAVVSIRFDHQFGPLRDSIWPLMVARGLPAAVGIVSRYPTGDPYSAGVTWADIHAIVNGGCEVWCHTATHYNPATLAALVDEIVTSKAEIEAQGFHVCGWHGAGVGANPTYPDWPLTYLTDMTGPVGRLVESNYGFSDGLISSTVIRSLPHSLYHGLSHRTGEVLTLAETKSYINQAVSYGCGLQLMYHPYYIGRSGYLTMADFTAVLDYIVTLRNAGTIEVLTATGLIAADPGRALRAQILGNSTFDPDPNLAWTGWSYGTGVCWRSTGGRSGGAVEFDQAGNAKLQQITSQPEGAGFAGGAVRVEAWMKMTTTAGTGVIRLVDHDTPANLDMTREFAVTSTTWTKVWFNTVLPPATARIRIELSRKAGSASLWMDDISVTPT